MYYPYFRGKQYELITIREMAPKLAAAGFCPIIEPVRDTLSGLQKALDAVVESGGRAIVIINPYHGDLSGSGKPITEFIQSEFGTSNLVSVGILLRKELPLDQAVSYYKSHADHTPVFVHGGFTSAKALVRTISDPLAEQRHIFVEDYCGKLYRRHFKGADRVLIRDGFRKKRSADYELVEPFSDLHITYEEEGVEGFGDFLTVGDDYSETGGPAYAVAIHLTYINTNHDDAMEVYHFVSDRQDTPTDPAGKFAEALDKMIRTIKEPDSQVIETDAVQEFRELHARGHFPGLGYAKKLSMNHHVETLKFFCAGTD